MRADAGQEGGLRATVRIFPCHALGRLLALALSCAGAAAGTPLTDPLHTGAESVELDTTERPPLIPPNTLFRVSDGEAEWRMALAAAAEPLSVRGGLPRRMDAVMLEGFRRVRKFRSETYSRGPEYCDLLWAISAEEAENRGQFIGLTDLRLAYFTTGENLPFGSRPAGRPGADSPLDTAPMGVSPRPAQAPKARGADRFVVTAKEGRLDMQSVEGEAHGDVRIEIFDDASSPPKRIGRISCKGGLRWRAWTEPATGRSELSMYAVSEQPAGKDDDGPEVKGEFVFQNPGDAPSHMNLEARGVLFQATLLDHFQPVVDEQGRTVGITNVLRRRVLFHRKVKVEIVGPDRAPVLPFQSMPTPVNQARKDDPAQPLPHSLTRVACVGPSILDLAVHPRKVEPPAPDQPAPLAQRFEFLNGVVFCRGPDEQELGAGPPPRAGPTRALLTCQHLCFQYPSSQMGSLPEYAEALGGVHMEGLRLVAEGAPPTPFRADCHRVYYDRATDATVLLSLPGTPVEIADEMGELSTQSCHVSRANQALNMWDTGPKRALVRATRRPTPAGEPPPPGAMDLGSADLEARWLGAFRREVISLPAPPGQPESVKEVLTLNRDVEIRQSARSLRILGQFITITRDAKSSQVERLEGRGRVLVRSGDMQVKGEHVTVDLRYNDRDELVQNTVVVLGDPRAGTQAVLWQGQSAVRSQRFVVDVINNNFQAYGGVVARVALPPPAENSGVPEAAGGAALMPGFSRTPGERLGLQCDGDFEFDGAAGRLRATGDVVINQTGMRIISDRMLLTLQPQPEPATKPAAEPKAKGQEPPRALFSGQVQSIECVGRVEAATPTQVIQCDRLFYDMLQDRTLLETTDPADVVRVYLQEPSGGTKLLQVTRRLDYDGKTGSFVPAARMVLRPYADKAPLPRTLAPRGPGENKP